MSLHNSVNFSSRALELIHHKSSIDDEIDNEINIERASYFHHGPPSTWSGANSIYDEIDSVLFASRRHLNLDDDDDGDDYDDDDVGDETQQERSGGSSSSILLCESDDFKNRVNWLGSLCFPGIGMFVEAYYIVTVGQIKTVWYNRYPACFDAGREVTCPNNIQCSGIFANEPPHFQPPNPSICPLAQDITTNYNTNPSHLICHPNVIKALSYAGFAGVMIGMLTFGTIADGAFGRKNASILAGILELAGVVVMTFLTIDDDVNRFWTIWAVFFGIFGCGIGGEYPLTAAGASERQNRRRRQQTHKKTAGSSSRIGWREQHIQRQQQRDDDDEDYDGKEENDDKIKAIKTSTREEIIDDASTTSFSEDTEQQHHPHRTLTIVTPSSSPPKTTSIKPTTTTTTTNLNKNKKQQKMIHLEKARSRGKTLSIAFAMQGVGAVFGSFVLVCLVYFSGQETADCGYLATDGDGGSSGGGVDTTTITTTNANEMGYVPEALDAIWRTFFFLGSLMVATMLVYRFFVSQESEGFDKVKERRKRRETTSIGRRRPRLWKILGFYAPSLIGTGICWMLWDVFFYGLKIFSGPIMDSLFPDAGLMTVNLFILLNNAINLCGYYCAAAVIDRPSVGRVRLQSTSFLISGILFLVLAAIFDSDDNVVVVPPSIVLLLYLVTGFVGQSGASVTTYVMAAETYPTEVRGTCHGLSAFLGKVGALVATVWFSYLDTRWIFITTGVTCLVALVVTLVFSKDMTNVSLAEHDAQLEMFLKGMPEKYKGTLNKPEHLSRFEIWTKHHGEYDPNWPRSMFDEDKKNRLMIENL